MRRAGLLGLGALCAVGFTIIGWLVVHPLPATHATLPTLVVIPSRTPSHTPTVTQTPTVTPSPTATVTATSSPTMTPSPTSTLIDRVVSVYAVMPDVDTPPTATPLPAGTVLPAPPPAVEPLPDATHESPPYLGWYRFESDHPSVRYQPVYWQPRLHTAASQGQYHRTDDPSYRAQVTFEGEAVRVRYIAARNMGVFQVWVDGVLLDTVDAYAPQLGFPLTQVYLVGRGAHTLELRPTGERNRQSEGVTVALDAVHVFRAPPHTHIIPPPAVTRTPSPSPQPARDIERVSAPVPNTPAPPVRVSASVVIGYDENANNQIDPAEGVRGVPVRLVAADTNRVLVTATTDAGGYARLSVETASPVRVVVPYFRRGWDVPTGGGPHTFELLLSAGNQPGLIP